MIVGYVVLGLCLLAALFVAGRVFVNADPKLLAKFLRYIIFGLVCSAAVFFLVTGRFAFGAPLALVAVSMLRRWSMPSWRFSFPGMGSSRSNQSSTVETEFLRMKLEHGSGVMSGEVLKGIYAGKDLAELNQNQVQALLEECEREDPEAAQLLEAYLGRVFGENWRGEDGGQPSDGEPRGGRRSGWGARAARGDMSPGEAREILGVVSSASTADIKEAHRRLILKNHPDRGGSSFLAAKINHAKEILLGE